MKQARVLCVLSLSVFLNGPVKAEINLALPADKTNAVSCRELALELHAGEVIQDKRIRTKKAERIEHIEIRDKSARTWLVVCNSESGTVLEDKLIDGNN